MKQRKVLWKEIILLLEFIIIMLIIISKGTLNNFVNPKMNKYIYASIPILVLFVIFGHKNKEENSKKKNITFWIISILLIILGIIGSNGNLSDNITKEKVTSISDTTIGRQKSSETEEITIPKELIEVNDANYIKTLDTIYENVEKYKGCEIKITGCVFRDEMMQENQFAMGKYYMYCCANDMSLTGFLFQYDNYTQIQNDKWYETVAQIDVIEEVNQYDLQVYKVPLLVVKEIKEIQKPKNIYVYSDF
jgi:putative membrane protein